MSHKPSKKNYSGDYDKYCPHGGDNVRVVCDEQPRGCIICPPYDPKESFESDFSERSCIDFSMLCQDNPRVCHEKKEKKEKKSYKKSCSCTSEESCKECSMSYSCRGCDNKCSECDDCKACWCKECSDYSKSSVIGSLGKSIITSCSDFDLLALDQKKKCKLSDKSHDKSHDKSYDKPCKEKKDYNKNKKFMISYGDKSEHPFGDCNETDNSIYVNGKNGPILHLYRGYNYFFCIDEMDEELEFMLTTSPCGGPNADIIYGSFQPLSKGCACFKVGKKTPRFFFYQNAKHVGQGGLVIIHDSM